VGIEVSGLHDHFRWIGKLQFFFDGRQPEAESIMVEVASASAITFHEGRSSEGLQTRAWRRKISSAASFTFAGVLEEGVTSP